MAREYPKSVKGWGEALRKYDVFARLNQLHIKHPKGYDDKQEELRSRPRAPTSHACGRSSRRPHPVHIEDPLLVPEERATDLTA
jgi:hypothetical protein